MLDFLIILVYTSYTPFLQMVPFLRAGHILEKFLVIDTAGCVTTSINCAGIIIYTLRLILILCAVSFWLFLDVRLTKVNNLIALQVNNLLKL